MSAGRIPATAKRGDLVAIVTTERTYVTGQESTERTRVALAVVTSVTRGGVVKAARTEYGGTLDLTRPDPRRGVLIVPAAMVDVDRAMAEYGTRRYPSAPHSTMVPPFDSVEECRAFLRPFLLRCAA